MGMMRRSLFIVILATVYLCLTGFLSRAQAMYIEPGTLPYLSFNDSPFNGESFDYFHLEDFEDHLFNELGVSADYGGVNSVIYGPDYHDSVDADDGAIDGSGLKGDDFFSWNDTGRGDGLGVTFSFNANILGVLPTHAGLVWTDGRNPILFEAFDSNGTSLGVCGPFYHANGSFEGETDEDRFYGVINTGGISAIKIMDNGGIEVDHLQYGRATPVPEPATLSLLGLGLFGLLLKKKKTA